MNLRKMEGKSMRILNRVIAASVLVVPMGLGVSGIAVADVAAGSSMLPTQIGVSEDECLGDCDDEDNCDDKDSGPLGFLSGKECEGDDGDDDNGLPG